MLGELSLSTLIELVALCLPAVGVQVILAIVRSRRRKKLGTAIVAGAFKGFAPYIGSLCLARLAVRGSGGRVEEQTCIFPGKKHAPPEDAPAAFLLHCGMCCAFQTSAGRVFLPRAPRRLMQIWPRCVLVPFAGYVYAVLLTVLVAMGPRAMGDRELIRLLEWAWCFFVVAGYAHVFISARSLEKSLALRYEDLREKYLVAEAAAASP